MKRNQPLKVLTAVCFSLFFLVACEDGCGGERDIDGVRRDTLSTSDTTTINRDIIGPTAPDVTKATDSAGIRVMGDTTKGTRKQ